MHLSRREFLQALAISCVSALHPRGFAFAGNKASPWSVSKSILSEQSMYDIPPFGNVSLMNFADCHAQLLPAYYREPEMHLGIGPMDGEIPHFVGEHLLDIFNIKSKSRSAYGLSYLDFASMAEKYGAMGGFAHMSTLVKKLRDSRPGALLLDSGDTWQGSATALWTNAQDMVDAALLLGVDVMTGHWEFTYGMDRVRHIIKNDFKGKIDFVAQNVVDLEFEDRVFKPYTIKEMNGVKIAIIGQAFPYTPIANPRYMVEKWQFGIREDKLQEIVDEVRQKGAQVVIVLSHDGMDLDMKLASRVTGIDAIFSGHTHDAVPVAYEAKNAGGTTLVIISGSMGKFIALLDLDVKAGKVRDYRFRLVPVFSNVLKPDAQMSDYINKVRAPYLGKLNEKLAVTNDLLYRRDTFTGPFDQLLCDSLKEYMDTDLSFSPGFRWGISVLPGSHITFEDVMSMTALTYPAVTKNTLTGVGLKLVLEDIADNRFNLDPYAQQGGDMVRTSGLQYAIDPTALRGKRIQDMEIHGKPVMPNKKYTLASWASVTKGVQGKPAWDVLAEYLRDKKVVSVKQINKPLIKNVKGNAGMP